MRSKNIPPNAIRSSRPGLITVLLLAAVSAAVALAGCAGSLTSTGSSSTPWAGNVVVSSVSNQFGAIKGKADDQTGDPIGILGTIQKLPDGAGLQGAWKINGLAVYATSGTQIDQKLGAARVGAEVEVMGWLQSDGSMKAAWIRVLAPLVPANAQGDAGAGMPRQIVTVVTPSRTPRLGITAPTATPAAPDPEPRIVAGSSTRIMSRPTQFGGNIERMLGAEASGMWQIGGQDVQVNPQTQVMRQVGLSPIGAYGYVLGWALPDGTIQAIDIDVTQPPLGQASSGAYLQNTVQHRLTWYAMLQELPQNGPQGVWIIGGQEIVVGSSTQIAGRQEDIRPGSFVRVTGWLQDDGSIHAQMVELGAPRQDVNPVPQPESSLAYRGPAVALPPANSPNQSAAGGQAMSAGANEQAGGGGDAPAGDQAGSITQPISPAEEPREASAPPDTADPTSAPPPPTAQPTPTPTPPPPTAEPTDAPPPPTHEPTDVPPPTAEPRDPPPPPAVVHPPVAVPQPGSEAGDGVPNAGPDKGKDKAKDQGGQGNKDQDKGKAKDQGAQGNKDQGNKDQGNGNGKAKDQGAPGNKDQGNGDGKAKGKK